MNHRYITKDGRTVFSPSPLTYAGAEQNYIDIEKVSSKDQLKLTVVSDEVIADAIQKSACGENPVCAVADGRVCINNGGRFQPLARFLASATEERKVHALARMAEQMLAERDDSNSTPDSSSKRFFYETKNGRAVFSPLPLAYALDDLRYLDLDRIKDKTKLTVIVDGYLVKAILDSEANRNHPQLGHCISMNDEIYIYDAGYRPLAQVLASAPAEDKTAYFGILVVSMANIIVANQLRNSRAKLEKGACA